MKTLNTPLESGQQRQNTIVLACSGASDLGELTDKLARRLRNNGNYIMKCLAMVAAEDKSLIENIRQSATLVIDGCGVDCGRKIMEEAWLSNYNYIRLTDFGYVKGKTPVTDELVESLYNRILSGEQNQMITGNIITGKSSCCGNN